MGAHYELKFEPNLSCRAKNSSNLFTNFSRRSPNLIFLPSRGGRTRLPKFKFSAKFPIGLHVILQIQIKKFENDAYIM